MRTHTRLVSIVGTPAIRKARLDGAIHDFLRGSCWAKGIPRELVDRSIELDTTAGAFRKSIDKSGGPRCSALVEFGTWSLTF